MSLEAESTPPAASPPGRSRRAEGLLTRFGERLNPILVKEARQALKSRQFVITFGLLLICGWGWSILGVAVVGPDVFYSARGPQMFIGYFLILAFSLLVIVPFGAFRSLAVEQEDRTYELLSITTLNPRQIVGGKLGSAVVQMLIYLSAISPCLAFTYLLHGIALPTILFALCYVVLASLGLAAVGLLAGTLFDEKHWQTVLSVLVIVGLLAVFYVASLLAIEEMDELERAFRWPEFWQGNAALLTAYVSYFALVFYAAAARITFASDNRSTRLRVIMLVQHVLFAGWMAWVWFAVERFDYMVLILFLMFVNLHWYAMGMLMLGESPELSLRVRRKLPQSFLGRVLLTWFNPGPGTGYVFALCGLLGALALVAVAVLVLGVWPGMIQGTRRADVVLTFGVLAACYAAIYLGAGLLVIRWIRTFRPVGVLTSALIQLVLVVVGCGTPLVLQLMSPDLRNLDYTLLQIPSPLWTLARIVDRSRLPNETPVLLVVVPFAAAIVFLLNLPGVVREVRHVRSGKPARVAEEDTELAARLAPPRPTRTSPWDDY